MNILEMLTEAQMHLEIVDLQLEGMEVPGLSPEQCLQTYREIRARLLAGVHLVQSLRIGRPDAELGTVLQEARAFNLVDQGHEPTCTLH